MSTKGTTSVRSQPVDAPLTKSATFIVLSLRDATPETTVGVRKAIAATQDLCKNVRVRDLHAQFACTVGIANDIWPALTKLDKPVELRTFRHIQGAKHAAVSTPGDIFYHVRSDRPDLCFTFEQQLMEIIGPYVVVQDHTLGFRYFDGRDLLGFVDGTANPEGYDGKRAVFVTDQEDPVAVAQGGSYVMVQKYLHDIQAWNKIPTELQEIIIGRRKFDNVELDNASEQEQKSHKTLCTIEADGEEFSVLRDNMPFGSPFANEFGTYFVGYSKQLWVLEKMLERMFLGAPNGKHDRILDYSKAVKGNIFFVPSIEILESFDDTP